MNTGIANTIGLDIEAVARDLHYCKQAQSWSPSSTRSSWTSELEAILEATTVDEMTEAVKVARQEAYRLAAIVTESLTDSYWLAERLDGEDIDVSEADDVADVVRIARTAGVKIDDAMMGKRDGLVLDADRAYVYATARSWDIDDFPYVTIDLLTGEVKHFD